ncbi:MAG: protein translocase subunit SecF [Spirochaetes bacterium]|nr:protein translocase subunit SecF [Spirochaetota bacterium]MBU0957103.1 protein translocase subunit SecF [Spirochaetota bacterium]
MKHYIKFHKAFLPAAFISVAFIIFSLVGVFTRGLNMGVDFRAGVNQYVRLAFPAGTIAYSGSGLPLLSITEDTLTVVFTGADVQSRTVAWDLATVGTMSQLGGVLAAENITLQPDAAVANLPALLLVPTYKGEFILRDAAQTLHRAPRDANEMFGSLEEVRTATASIDQVAVKNFGKADSMQYVIRVSDDGTDKNFAENITKKLSMLLGEAFGADHYVFMQTDYVGARFSKDLGNSAWQLVLGTVLLILLYAAIRFKPQYGVAAVLAVLHDGIIMLGFMVWSNMEFNTISIAAILTILGYSINDTIVIFDRIREDRKLAPTDSITTILDRSVNETLGRTVITTVTTLLAVFALFFFTTGSIHDFALALIVGLLVGTYSTIFIATAFVRLWDYLRLRRTPEAVAKHMADVKPAN